LISDDALLSGATTVFCGSVAGQRERARVAQFGYRVATGDGSFRSHKN